MGIFYYCGPFRGCQHIRCLNFNINHVVFSDSYLSEFRFIQRSNYTSGYIYKDTQNYRKHYLNTAVLLTKVALFCLILSIKFNTGGGTYLPILLPFSYFFGRRHNFTVATCHSSPFHFIYVDDSRLSWIRMSFVWNLLQQGLILAH